MYDRDWYREEYSRRESQKRSNRRNVPSNSGKITLIIMLFALIFFIVRSVSNLYVDFPVTIGLIAVNIVMFALIKTGKLYYESMFSSYEMTIRHKGYYRVASSAFTHEEPLHIIVNMGSLYNLGVVLEPVLGSNKYLFLYIVIMIVEGFISAYLHKLKNPYARSIGASGVICGLLGVYIVLAIRVAGISGIKSVVPTILLMCLMTASKRIDSIAHFVGLAVGIVCAVIMVSI